MEERKGEEGGRKEKVGRYSRLRVGVQILISTRRLPISLQPLCYQIHLLDLRRVASRISKHALLSLDQRKFPPISSVRRRREEPRWSSMRTLRDIERLRWYSWRLLLLKMSRHRRSVKGGGHGEETESSGGER